jgi:rhodanese-related sulfurtransferase
MTRLNLKPLWFPAFLAVILTASFAAGAAGVTFISAAQLKNDLAKPDVTVIDVRVEPEWNSSQMKIKGAVRESPQDVKDWMSKYPKDKTIVLYCD